MMDFKEIGYLVEGFSSMFTEVHAELYEALVAKGKKRMGQEGATDSPQVSEIIRRARERQTVEDLLGKGEQETEELVQSVGALVRKTLSSAGIVTRADLARVEKRMDEIEEALADKGY